jgi:hypothetical protein
MRPTLILCLVKEERYVWHMVGTTEVDCLGPWRKQLGGRFGDPVELVVFCFHLDGDRDAAIQHHPVLLLPDRVSTGLTKQAANFPGCCVQLNLLAS